MKSKWESDVKPGTKFKIQPITVPIIRKVVPQEADSPHSPFVFWQYKTVKLVRVSPRLKRKKEELVMRNRFHKEPLNKENVIRPDQAGTKENPDYVVNIAGEWKRPCYN